MRRSWWEIDYEPLPALVTAAEALADGAAAVWDDVPGNICAEFSTGDEAAVAAAFSGAAHVATVDLDNQRVLPAPIETRGAIGGYDPASGHFTLTCASQNVHANRNDLAKVFHVEPSQLRVVAPDIGGGFGVKNAAYPDMRSYSGRRNGPAARSNGFRTAAKGSCRIPMVGTSR